MAVSCDTSPSFMASSEIGSRVSFVPETSTINSFAVRPGLDRARSFGLVDTTWYETLPLRGSVVPASFTIRLHFS